VADEVAILHDGRIVRQADTEALRRDVKQIITSRENMAAVRNELSVLDERFEGDRVAVTVEGTERAVPRLSREGVQFQVVDLNLDEIFEAYVAGRVSHASAAKPQAELQPLG
jgi:ABC-2 type transport system ATP-binding protein